MTAFVTASETASLAEVSSGSPMPAESRKSAIAPRSVGHRGG